MTENKNLKPVLQGTDDSMNYQRIGDDILWGIKSWRNEAGHLQYLMEAWIRSVDHPEPVYLREKVVNDYAGEAVLSLVTRFVPYLSDPEKQRELFQLADSLENV